MIQSYNAINSLRQHIKDGARIHGVITDGGEAANIVPAHTAASFFVRAVDDEYLDALKDKVIDCSGALSKGGVEGETFFRIPDRGEAIRFALQQAQPGDLVYALGKGHEQSMCFGETEYPWDDRTAMRAALADHLDVQGPAMPELPTNTMDSN